MQARESQRSLVISALTGILSSVDLDDASLVRKAGRLVYATCSLLAEENEDQVTAFLSRHPGFTQTDVLALSPARHATDGFFAVVLERSA